MMRLGASAIHDDFRIRVEDLSGQNLTKCYQCGKCSAGCPMIYEMDLLPNQVIRLTQLGDEEVLNSRTIWICSTCFTCYVRCPKGINVCAIMEALRDINLRKGEDHYHAYKFTIDERKEFPPIAVVSAMRKHTG